MFFVWGNWIGPDGCRSLSQNLPSLTQLQNLNLECNDCFIFSYFLFLLSMFTFCWNGTKKNLILFHKKKSFFSFSDVYKRISMFLIKYWCRKNKYMIKIVFRLREWHWTRWMSFSEWEFTFLNPVTELKSWM